MLKTILLFIFCAYTGVYCASISKNLYDQYITLPQVDINCSELRKQFADGYIQIKEFIDRIRTCKEALSLTSQNAIQESSLKKSYLYQQPRYTYNDYLVPVLRTSLPQAPTVLASSNSQLYHTNLLYKNMQIVPNLPTQNYRYSTKKSFLSRGRDEINVFASNNTAQDKISIYNQGPVTNTAEILPEYQTKFTGYSKSIPAAQSPAFIPSSISNAGIQYNTVITKPSATVYNPSQFTSYATSPSYKQQNVAIGNKQQTFVNTKTSSFISVPTSSKSNAYVRTNSGGWSDYFQFRNILNSLGYNKDQKAVNNVPRALVPGNTALIGNPGHIRNNVAKNGQIISNIATSGPLRSNVAITGPLRSNIATSRQRNVVATAGLLNNNIDITGQLHGNVVTPGKVRSNMIINGRLNANLNRNNELKERILKNSPITRSQLIKDEIKLIDRDLKDDVSMLNENSGTKHQFSLKDYETLAPRIIENIAARSKINFQLKDIGNVKKSSDVSKMNNGSNNSVKDILDIKYSQLEDKLLNDIRKRQAMLQRLEQESMVEHYSNKLKPTAMPMEKLGEVFKSMSDEELSRNIFQNETDTASILAGEYPQDNMGFFQDSKIPTKRRVIEDINSSSSNKGYKPKQQEQLLQQQQQPKQQEQLLQQQQPKQQEQLIQQQHLKQQEQMHTSTKDVPNLNDKLMTISQNLLRTRINKLKLPRNVYLKKTRVRSYMPTPVINYNDETLANPTQESSTDPDLKGYVNIGPISPNGFLNVENVEGSKNELSSNQLKTYLNPLTLINRQSPMQTNMVPMQTNMATMQTNMVPMQTNMAPDNIHSSYVMLPEGVQPAASENNLLPQNIDFSQLSEMRQNIVKEPNGYGVPVGTVKKDQLVTSNNKISQNNDKVLQNRYLSAQFQKNLEKNDNIESKKNNIETLNNLQGTIDTNRKTYSRNILFTDKFYNNLLRSAMKKKTRSIHENDSFNTIEKKSTIINEQSKIRQKRWFDIDVLQFGIHNGNSID